jgi:hypothetical protein
VDQARPSHTLGDAAGLGDHAHPLGAVDDLGDPSSDHLVVVDDHDADLVVGLGGLACRVHDHILSGEHPARPVDAAGDLLGERQSSLRTDHPDLTGLHRTVLRRREPSPRLTPGARRALVWIFGTVEA